MGRENSEKMITQPIAVLIPKLALPTTISMLISSIYNMVDTYFVSKLGTSASGAVGIIFSMMALIQAVGFTIGMGSGILISRQLGEQDAEQADENASSALALSFILGIFILVMGLLFLKPMVGILGASKTIRPYAVEYGRYIFWSAPFMTCSYVLSTIIRASGHPIQSMIGIAVGGILNFILDPILIFYAGMGISGAALATAISQAAGCLFLFFLLRRKNSEIHFKISNISHKVGIYLTIIKNGMPSFDRQGAASLATILLNRSAVEFGDAAVAAVAIVGKIFMILFSVMIGFAQGYQPVVGFNEGANKYDRVKNAFLFTTIAGTIVMSVLAFVCYLNADYFMKLFIQEEKAVTIGICALRAQCIAIPVIPICVVSNITFQALEKQLWANLTSLMRQCIFFVPLILTLPHYMGLRGVYLSQPLADGLTFLGTIPFLVLFLRERKA